MSMLLFVILFTFYYLLAYDAIIIKEKVGNYMHPFSYQRMARNNYPQKNSNMDQAATARPSIDDQQANMQTQNQELAQQPSQQMDYTQMMNMIQSMQNNGDNANNGNPSMANMMNMMNMIQSMQGNSSGGMNLQSMLPLLSTLGNNGNGMDMGQLLSSMGGSNMNPMMSMLQGMMANQGSQNNSSGRNE